MVVLLFIGFLVALGLAHWASIAAINRRIDSANWGAAYSGLLIVGIPVGLLLGLGLRWKPPEYGQAQGFPIPLVTLRLTSDGNWDGAQKEENTWPEGTKRRNELRTNSWDEIQTLPTPVKAVVNVFLIATAFVVPLWIALGLAEIEARMGRAHRHRW